MGIFHFFVLLFLSSPLQQNKFENLTVTDEDFEHLFQLVEKKDGGPPWKHMMDRSVPHMSYQAWQRDPEVANHLNVIMFLFIFA